MPHFEVARADDAPAMVRARDAADAVRRHGGLDRDRPLALAEPEPGTGWQAATVGGAPWGRVRARDRMRFRRD